jgi:hypothetical protein
MNSKQTFPIPVVDLSFICRMCEHMAEAYALGQLSCGKSDCGGLSVGKSFPLYKGPLSTVLTNYCFRCGDDSANLLRPHNGRAVGVCAGCLGDITGDASTST